MLRVNRNWCILACTLSALAVLAIGIIFVLRYHALDVEGSSEHAKIGWYMLAAFCTCAVLLYFVDRNGGYYM